MMHRYLKFLILLHKIFCFPLSFCILTAVKCELVSVNQFTAVNGAFYGLQTENTVTWPFLGQTTPNLAWLWHNFIVKNNIVTVWHQFYAQWFTDERQLVEWSTQLSSDWRQSVSVQFCGPSISYSIMSMCQWVVLFWYYNVLYSLRRLWQSTGNWSFRFSLLGFGRRLFGVCLKTLQIVVSDPFMGYQRADWFYI